MHYYWRSFQLIVKSFPLTANTLQAQQQARQCLHAIQPLLRQPLAFFCAVFTRRIYVGLLLSQALFTAVSFAEEKAPNISPSQQQISTQPHSCHQQSHNQFSPLTPLGPDHDPNATYVSADNTEFIDGGVSQLTGDIIIRQGNTQIAADQAIINQPEQQAKLSGSITLQSPDIRLIGRKAQVQLDTKTSTFSNAIYQLPKQQARGNAKTITNGGDITTIINGQYTSCPEGDNTWVLNGKEIILDQEEGWGKAKNVVVKVKNVPVFYTPYIVFPINDERRSGLLIPSISHSNESGLDLSIPYYFNIAPNYDATITPRYLSKRGIQIESEFRYLSKNNQGELALAALPGDNAYQNEDRELSGWKHKGKFNNGVLGSSKDKPWWFDTDINHVSDTDYFDDLGTELNVQRESNLNQSIQARYVAPTWSLKARMQSYQNVDASVIGFNEPYRRLPEVFFDSDTPIYRSEASTNGFSFLLNESYTYFDHTDDTRIKGQRWVMEPGLRYRYDNAHSFFQPTFRINHTRYNLNGNDGTTPESQSTHAARTVPILSIDSGLFFERAAQWAEKSYLQTLEPRLFYLHVPHKTQDTLPNFDSNLIGFSYAQLFSENRFTGYDRIGDADQISFGLSSRLLQANGTEKARASIGQIYYLDDQEVADTSTDDESHIVGEAYYQWRKSWSINNDMEWDPDNRQVEKGGSYLSFSEHNLIWNTGYRYTHNGDKQSDISSVFQLNHNWHALGRWLYDLEEHKSIDQIVGIGYESCCWSSKLLLQHLRVSSDTSTLLDETDTRIMLHFELKGLAGFNQKTNNLINNSIPGYQHREQ